jgi:hypothetical protein
LADRHPRTLTTGPIFQRTAENILDLGLVDPVAVDVGFFGLRVYVVADVHNGILRATPADQYEHVRGALRILYV